jgi:phage terminase small subunit
MAKKPDIPKTPAGLSERARRLWRAVVGRFELEAHHLALLQAACEQVSIADAASKDIRERGPLVTSRLGATVENPACKMHRAASLATLRLLRELSLDSEFVEEIKRGPINLMRVG